MKEKNTFVTRSCVLSDAQMLNNFFLENYITSDGAVSHHVLYYQPLPLTHYQERFYANNYFE